MPQAAAAAAGLRPVIVLDTNVLSALMRTEPDSAELGWLDRRRWPCAIPRSPAS